MASAYRQAEKRWRVASASDAEVVDVDRWDGRVRALPPRADAARWLQSARVYELEGAEGFRLLRSPFSPLQQLRLCAAALCEWAEPPNESNLLLHHGPVSRLFDAHLAGHSLLHKLSWVTLGYHYQWTPRRYDARRRSPFPRELGAITSELAHAAGYAIRPEAAIVNYYHSKSTMGMLRAARGCSPLCVRRPALFTLDGCAPAPPTDRTGGHLDDAEPYQSAPIVSLSFGLSALFLLGGETRDVEPIPILLRSGDVIVQGGASRSHYHGVARIYDGTCPEYFAEGVRASMSAEAYASELGAERERHVAEWIQHHRININIRQVAENVGWDSSVEQAEAVLSPPTPAPPVDVATASTRACEAFPKERRPNRPLCEGATTLTHEVREGNEDLVEAACRVGKRQRESHRRCSGSGDEDMGSRGVCIGTS
eukprot:scaffold136305_cov33-Tisochrysis_lutea.AAC.2